MTVAITPTPVEEQVPPVEPTAPVLSDNPEADAAALATYEASQAALKGANEGEPPAGEEEQDADEGAEAVAEAAGLDFEALGVEYAEKGDLSPESYEALAKIGISDDMVKSYLAGVEARSAVNEAEVLSTIGGAEKYAEISQWALENMSEEDLAEYNAAVTNPKTAKFAVRALAAQYEQAEGKAPNLVTPSGPASNKSAAFQSSAEVVAAMQDPRYRNDPAYQRQVQQRLAMSSVF